MAGRRWTNHRGHINANAHCFLQESRCSYSSLSSKHYFRLFQHWTAAVGRTDTAKKRPTLPLKWEIFSLMLFNQPAAAAVAVAHWRKASTPDHNDTKHSRKSAACLESKSKCCIAASVWTALSRMSFIFVSFGWTSCRFGVWRVCSKHFAAAKCVSHGVELQWYKAVHCVSDLLTWLVEWNFSDLGSSDRAQRKRIERHGLVKKISLKVIEPTFCLPHPDRTS